MILKRWRFFFHFFLQQSPSSLDCSQEIWEPNDSDFLSHCGSESIFLLFKAQRRNTHHLTCHVTGNVRQSLSTMPAFWNLFYLINCINCGGEVLALTRIKSLKLRIFSTQSIFISAGYFIWIILLFTSTSVNLQTC